MAPLKLESCQTLRYHCNECKHNITLVATDKTELVNMPMLAVVNAYIKMVDTLDTNKVYPTYHTSINCRGEAVVMPTQVKEEIISNLGEMWMLLIATSLDLLAKAKDSVGYSFKFQTVVDKLADGTQGSRLTMDVVRQRLITVQQILQRLE